jgi:flagellum-specific ATP synthase
VGLEKLTTIGSQCQLKTRSGRVLWTEVLGFRDDKTLLMPFGALEGIGIGDRIAIKSPKAQIYPTSGWLGRILNGFGEPIDEKGPVAFGEIPYYLHQSPPPAHTRGRVRDRLDLGIRALNTFTTCCYGQRMGIFAGSGVGKSMLMSMIAKYTKVDINVIGLIGERGREVQEFLEEYLGEEGLSRSIVVVATSDESALMRRQAAYLTLTIAEYFRDQGKQVMCMMDSVTRFAMAQREIGLSMGEPPASKGYTPTVFSQLPKLLERAGPGEHGQGSITGLFTVLVEGDDHNEPISDAVRGILDGHIVLDRNIAERGRYPAINILRSVSRTMPMCNSEEETGRITKAKRYLSLYEDMSEMIRIGAYKKGSDLELDEAIYYYPRIEEFLKQAIAQNISLEEGHQLFEEILK